MPEDDDLTRELRRHGDRIDRSLVAVDPAELRRRAEGGGPAPMALGTVEPPRRSRLPLLAVAAVVFSVLGIVGAFLIGARDDRSRQVDTVVAPVSGSWTTVPDHLFPDPAMVTDVEGVWTGTEVLLVGALSATGVPDDVQGKGMAPLGEIPAFAPASGTWRTIAPPPIELPGADLEIAWTGSELVVTGPAPLASGPTASAQGAAYDPATDAWRLITPAPPGRGIGGTAAWADGRMLFWDLGAGVSAYDPSTDTWSTLTTEPVGTAGSPSFNSATATAVWTGSELVVADDGSTGIAAFNPAAATWRRLPDRPGTALGSLTWTGRVLGSGDVRGPAWMAPNEASWHQPIDPPPDDALAIPGAQAWVGDRFLAWGGPGYGGAPGDRPQLDAAVALDLPTGTWSIAPGPPVGDPPFADAVVAGDRIFTFAVDNDFQHLAGHGTIRAALSSPSFATGTALLGPPIAPPGIDPAATEFCAAFHTFLDTYQQEVAVSGPALDPAQQEELLDRARADLDDLVAISPPEIRGAMEVVQQSIDRVDTTAYRPDEAEEAASEQIDDWLRAHCGFTTSNPDPVPGTAPAAPGSFEPPETAPSASTVVGNQGP